MLFNQNLQDARKQVAQGINDRIAKYLFITKSGKTLQADECGRGGLIVRMPKGRE